MTRRRFASALGRLPRALWRLARCVSLLLRGTAICALRMPRLDAAARLVEVGRWSRQMLDALDIRLVVDGPGVDAAAPGAALWVANHVSWLDILAINAVQPVRFVSKADVRRWPLLGWLVACGGTLFIERERKRDALRVVHLMAEALAAGERIAVFPEGTTSDGHGVLPFHANLLQPAVATAVPLQPVALRFSDDLEPVSRAAAFVGEQTLAASVWAVLGARGLVVRVTVLAPVAAVGDRRRLADRLREMIAGALV